MWKRTQVCATLCMLFFGLSTVYAQTTVETHQRSSWVMAATATEQVRFSAPAEVFHLRLEVFDAAGRRLYDSDFKPGNLLDWDLLDQQGQRLADGAYRCVVTIQTLAGQTSQKHGLLVLTAGQPALQSPGPDAQAIQVANPLATISRADFLTILDKSNDWPLTLLAHDGEQGRLMSGRGGLSFRTGGFFTGKDQELMRLTTEGRLGLGVAEPQAKLDVAGTIRTSEGIVFPDGTVQTTAYVASSHSLSERVGLQRDAPGRSVSGQDKPGSVQQMLRLAPAATPGRLAKFAGDGTTPVDTQLSESNGALLVGNAGATGNIQIFGPANADVFAGMGPDVINGPAFNYGYAGASFGRSAGFFNMRPDASAVAPNPSLRFLTANQQRMIITNTGNVGIGLTSPQYKLHVSGGGGTAVHGTTTDFDGVHGHSSSGVGLHGSTADGVAGVFRGLGNYPASYALGIKAMVAVVHPASNWGLAITRAANDSGTANLVLYKTRNSDASTPTAVQENDFIGRISWQAPDTSNTNRIAAEIGVQTGVLDDTSVPSQMTFSTTPLGGSPTVRMRITSLGHVTPGSDDTSSLGLNVSRWTHVWATDGSINTSDARLKRNVSNLGYGLREVLQLRPVTFFWKDRDDGKLRLGLIAQEVEPLIPEAIVKGDDASAPIGLNYSSLLPVLIKAIQEQQATLEQKEAEIKTLKAENAALQQRNAELDARLAALERAMQQLLGNAPPLNRP